MRNPKDFEFFEDDAEDEISVAKRASERRLLLSNGGDSSRKNSKGKVTYKNKNSFGTATIEEHNLNEQD